MGRRGLGEKGILGGERERRLEEEEEKGRRGEREEYSIRYNIIVI